MPEFVTNRSSYPDIMAQDDWHAVMERRWRCKLIATPNATSAAPPLRNRPHIAPQKVQRYMR